MPEERSRALESAVSQIKKQYGDGAVMRLGEATHLAVETIPTGSLALDLALGVGGVPRGRVTEIFGPESSGKTTLCQHIVAEAQKQGGTCAYIDMEHALDPGYAAKCGVDVDNLYISQPDTGMQARLMSQARRKLSGAIKQTNTAMVFTNQLRQKIGVMFGNPETTTGGMALKFYASVRLDVRRVESIKVGQEVVGSRTRVRVVKNKVAAPFRVAGFDILYNEGISKVGDVLDLGVETGLIEKRGSFYTYGETKIGQGRENAKQYLRENPDLAQG